jgi:hypothetical protein
MIRLLVAFVLGVCGTVGARGADLPVERYLRDPVRVSPGVPRYVPAPQRYQPALRRPPYRGPLLETPRPTELLPPPQSSPSHWPPYVPVPGKRRIDEPARRVSPFFLIALLALIAGGLLVFAIHAAQQSPALRYPAFARVQAEYTPPTSERPTMSTDGSNRVMQPERPMPTPRKEGFPSQEDWAARAGKVKNPISGFLFRFGARSNARAMEEERERMKSARGLITEYAGMYADLLKGEEAATAYGLRRDLAGEFYDHGRANQQEVFDEAAHQRQLAEKRRHKEMTEADTRQIEADHEQEAVVRFKEPKFAAGLARFEEKQKGYQVGAASADAAIAETKGPTASEQGANDNAEVVALYALLQEKMRAIEEAERVGQDTQVLRGQVELYKKLLNLT